MSVSLVSTALIPYIPAKTPMEFIRAEVERGLANGSISNKQTIPRQISSSPSIDLDLINLNLSFLAKIFGESSGLGYLSLSSRRIKKESDVLLPSGSMRSVSSISTALIPYTPPKTPMEFIRSEVERGLANSSISSRRIDSRSSYISIGSFISIGFMYPIDSLNISGYLPKLYGDEIPETFIYY